MIGEALYQKYFGKIAAEDEQDAQIEREKHGMKKEFVTRDGYFQFREEIKMVKKANRPRPGHADGVNYGLGVRDGVELIEDIMDRWETEVRRFDG